MDILTAPYLPVSIGVDFGQVSDPSTIAVVELSQVPTGKFRYSKETLGYYDEKGNWVPGATPIMATLYTIRHIERIALGTSYPDIAKYIVEILCSDVLRYRSVRLLCDITGVGRAVYGDVQKEIQLRKEAQKVILLPITFVSGNEYNRSNGSLGKGYMTSRMQSLLQNGRIVAPDVPEVAELQSELKSFEIRVSQAGRDSYGAVSGAHDDLVICTGLACLIDVFGEQVTFSERMW